jgi:hypothetical protein
VSYRENAPNEYSAGIIILDRKFEIHPPLENGKKTQVKVRRDICGMTWKGDYPDLTGDKFV